MPVPDRLLRHACVLLAAASLPLLVPHAAAALKAATVVTVPSTGEPAIPVSATLQRLAAATYTERPAQTIVANTGDTLESLATTFHSDPAAMRWANAVPDVTQPAPGTPLLVPPGPGALVPVRGDERPSAFASRLGLDPRIVLDYNVLKDDGPVPAGSWLQVPRAVAPGGSLPADAVVPIRRGVPGVASTQTTVTHVGAARFPYGQCTYWVWTKRNVPWTGDAWAWFGNARAYHRPEGRIPVEGAIAVMWGSWVGHVAYVEHVNLDGSFVVSEMNVQGVGVVDRRTLTVSGADLIGFIY